MLNNRFVDRQWKLGSITAFSFVVDRGLTGLGAGGRENVAQFGALCFAGVSHGWGCIHLMGARGHAFIALAWGGGAPGAETDLEIYTWAKQILHEVAA